MPLGAARAVVIRATASTPGSTGFVIASAGANVNDGGNTAWTSPGNITAQDAVRATCNRTTNGTSQLLYATFNLSAIPADATDFKFIVRVRRDYSTVTPPQQIRDSAIRLTLDGSTMVGDNKADTGLDWPQATDEVGRPRNLDGRSLRVPREKQRVQAC